MSHFRSDMYDPFADVERPSRCMKFLRLLWKLSRCVFSHVTLVSLVVAYCVIGAYAFESLEAEHEKQIKKNVKYLRGNVTEKLWKITKEVEVLVRENWTSDALRELQGFESNLFTLLRKEGWDGSEEENNIQWTFAGALFYSIVVITTIGYGHIAPKTKNGKVVTIFYAVLGIPLMLLCLSNIGDVMASSFRFLYWKVCCYVCTKPPKKRRTRSNLTRSYSMRQSGRHESSRAPSFRRSVRLNHRSADATLGIEEGLTRYSYSDTDCRYNARRSNGADTRRSYVHQIAATSSPRATVASRNLDLLISTSKVHTTKGNPRLTTQSLDRRLTGGSSEADRSPVLCNKYALDDVEKDSLPWQATTCSDKRYAEKCVGRRAMENQLDEGEGKEVPTTRSLPRRYHSVEGTITNQRAALTSPYHLSSVQLGATVQPRRYHSDRCRRSPSNYASGRFHRRDSLPRLAPSSNFAIHRQLYYDDMEMDYDYYSNNAGEEQLVKPVPIWLCVFLVVSYILGGAFLFSKWEKWPFLDSAYFCFITLTTIGFGDFVPEYKLDAHKGIALCSLYLLFGIALLAMSFNLVQEEVINNVKSVAKRLGILKESEDEYEDDDNDDDDYKYDAEYEDEIDDMELQR